MRKLLISLLLMFSICACEEIEIEGKVGNTTNSGDEVMAAKYTFSYVDSEFVTRNCELEVDILRSEIQDDWEYIYKLEKASYNDLGVDLDKYKKGSDEFYQQVWKKIYKRIYKQGMKKMKDVVAGLKKLFRENGFTDEQAFYFLVNFIQNIKYKRPGRDLDLLTSKLCLGLQYGDCDTKSLLLYVILEQLGYDCLIYLSEEYGHAMLGIAMNGSGSFKKYDGKKYYFLETTATDYEVGMMPPKWDDLKYWYGHKL